jgi:hypothetical protein
MLLFNVNLDRVDVNDVRIMVEFPDFCQGLEEVMLSDDLYGVCKPPPVPDLDDVPVLASFYDYALGGVNCNESCDDLALVQAHSNLYFHTIACPIGLTTHGFTTQFHIPALKRYNGTGNFVCLDTGRDIKLTYRDVWMGADIIRGWFIVLDFLWQGTPPFAMGVFHNWSTSAVRVDYR